MYVWLDIFAINQDKGRAMEELDDGRTLARVIEASAATLVVLDSEAFALTRLWCLYETRRLWAHFAVACLLVAALFGTDSRTKATHLFF